MINKDKFELLDKDEEKDLEEIEKNISHQVQNIVSTRKDKALKTLVEYDFLKKEDDQRKLFILIYTAK